jgi:threonyl-tRNA synthetase
MADISTIRHSLAHILAMAVLKLWPDAKLAFGPATEDGFYYDFDLQEKISEKELLKIAEKMQEIIKEGHPFVQDFLSPSEAKKVFKNQPYKLEQIEKIIAEGEKQISVYKTADFIDLCKGPHVKSTKECGAFKLVQVAGAYWLGSEKNPMLQRIYGVAFATKEELETHLKLLAEAKLRDHRKLGVTLGLFLFSDLVGPGLPLYTPLGTRLRNQIVKFSRELRESIGYQEVTTPQINKIDLFRVSGHLEKYAENMFSVSSHYSQKQYFLKPMNCPQHIQIYASSQRSYKDLPIRFADFGFIYRDEKMGELLGLSRLRAFSQDDGHCFCRPDQLETEFSRLFSVIDKAMQAYDFAYRLRLSLRDPKKQKEYLGDEALWQHAESLMRKLLKERGVNFTEAPGEAAFYGPKVDLIVKDSLQREWQLSTIQLDFNMPKRFGIYYIDENAQKQTPIMIHSAIVGSPERLMAMLLEHYAGALPFWLAPLQMVVLPVSEKVLSFAQKINAKLQKEGFFTELWQEDSLSRRIRQAEILKVPVMLVVGEKEKKANLLNLRLREKKEQFSISLQELISKAKETLYKREKSLSF